MSDRNLRFENHIWNVSRTDLLLHWGMLFVSDAKKTNLCIHDLNTEKSNQSLQDFWLVCHTYIYLIYSYLTVIFHYWCLLELKTPLLSYKSALNYWIESKVILVFCIPHPWYKYPNYPALAQHDVAVWCDGHLYNVCKAALKQYILWKALYNEKKYLTMALLLNKTP